MTETIGGWMSSDEEVDPPAELSEFQPSLDPLQLWRTGTGSGTNEQYLKLSPVVANQKVFIADSEGRITAYDATDGDRVWNHQIKTSKGKSRFGLWSSGDQFTITGGAGYGEDAVLVGTSEGHVIALDADNGKELWRSTVSSEVLSAPQKQNNIVVVRTLDGKLFGLDGDNGQRLWTYDRSVPSLTLRGTSTPIIYQGVVICGFDGGKLAALELQSGRIIWETSVATSRGRSELERMVDIDSEPVIIQDVIYVVSFQGQMAAMAIDSGRVLWTRDVSSYAGFSVDDYNVYVTDDKSILWAFDRFSGSSVWKQDGLYNRAVTAPATIGNYIVVGDFEGYLHWMNKTNGAFAARTRLSDKRIIAAPLVNDQSVYGFASDGKLAAYRIP